MKRQLRRLVARLLNRLVRIPRLKLIGQRVLSHFPRLRGLVLRIMHGGSWRAPSAQPVTNAFDTRGERQQRLLDDLQQRWNRPSP
ncbi:hypothetical protein HOP52_09715 [Halomonas campisalis]|uniref:Uncharacterized protein n=1 Tax=Billgrantia campisalis TaxID=74661 RepID=A0ABS9P8C8_9GAMM|nr:hypothetical protein [Halomonas campisalis]MCG6658030.1 hypothetical protein [Halomonas campisalis]MDR5862697.1 hypothetical protein [Halomonas campisalis]